VTAEQAIDTVHRYDDIGRSYARHRRPDPRITRQINAALGDAERIVDVGAGAGSYEPPDRHVLAVEPSPIMIANVPWAPARSFVVSPSPCRSPPARSTRRWRS
jgi:hypothetical protein